MRKTLINMLFLIFAVMLLSACATTSAVTWKANDAQGIIGKTEKQIIEQFGQPDRISRSKNKKVFEYRKPAEKESATNAFMAFGSYGMASGKNSMYVDILQIIFNKKGVVVDFSYAESVMGASLPGGLAPANASISREPEAQPEDLDEEKPAPPPVKKKVKAKKKSKPKQNGE
jgi:hypothetical protein